MIKAAARSIFPVRQIPNEGYKAAKSRSSHANLYLYSFQRMRPSLAVKCTVTESVRPYGLFGWHGLKHAKLYSIWCTKERQSPTARLTAFDIQTAEIRKLALSCQLFQFSVLLTPYLIAQCKVCFFFNDNTVIISALIKIQSSSPVCRQGQFKVFCLLKQVHPSLQAKP